MNAVRIQKLEEIISRFFFAEVDRTLYVSTTI